MMAGAGERPGVVGLGIRAGAEAGGARANRCRLGQDHLTNSLPVVLLDMKVKPLMYGFVQDTSNNVQGTLNSINGTLNSIHGKVDRAR